MTLPQLKRLGEMMPAQLKETTMDPAKLIMMRLLLLRSTLFPYTTLFRSLMGSKAEARFAFISDKAEFASEDLFDVIGSADVRRSQTAQARLTRLLMSAPFSRSITAISYWLCKSSQNCALLPKYRPSRNAV